MLVISVRFSSQISLAWRLIQIWTYLESQA